MTPRGPVNGQKPFGVALRACPGGHRRPTKITNRTGASSTYIDHGQNVIRQAKKVIASAQQEPPVVFELLYESRQNVLLTRIYKTFVPDDIFVRDKIVARFVVTNGPARGIMDCSGIDKVAVPMPTLVRRAHAPPVLPGADKVIVAPQDLQYEIGRVFAAHTMVSRKSEPLLVRSLTEAYRALRIVDPHFQPLDRVAGVPNLERAVHRLVTKVDRAYGGGRAATIERDKVRATFLRLIGAAAGQAGEQRTARRGRGGAHPPETIRASDVLNAVMRHAILTDGDLITTCPTCRAPRSLDMCRVSTGRKTTYACATCDSALVVLTPARPGAPRPPEQGYPFGRFGMMNVAAVECVGARLPRHPQWASLRGR
jgi:hypothetical protein